MAMIVGYDQIGGQRVYLNLDHVVKVEQHPASGSSVTLINGEAVHVAAEPKTFEGSSRQ